MNWFVFIGVIGGFVLVATLLYFTWTMYVNLKEAETKNDELEQEIDELEQEQEGIQALRHEYSTPVYAAPPPPPYVAPSPAPLPVPASPLPEQTAPEQKVVQFQEPPPPDVEEWNDIRVFYTATLPFTISKLDVENCVECELLDAVIPRGDYVIHSRNQTFQIRQPFEASVTTYTDVTIPEGDYTLAALVTAITNLVATAGLTSFACSTSTLTSNVTVQDDSVVDISLNTELAYDLGWGTTTTLNLGSVQYPTPNLSYTVAAGGNTFSVSVSSGASVTYTVAAGTYTPSTLATAMNTAMAATAGLTAAYISNGGGTIAIYHTTGNSLDVRLGDGMMKLFGQSSPSKSTLFNSSSNVYYASSTRADLYGSRYVEIRTNELNAPHLHRRGVLQSAFLENSITNWRSDGGDELRRRRFQIPRSIRSLTISFKERHPSKSDESDFHDMELNGLAISLRICFRRLRYKNDAYHGQLDQH